MLFQSQGFILIFLPATLAAFYALANRPTGREYALILASLIFYGWWDPRFIPLLVGQTIFTWMIAEAFLRKPSPFWIWIGVAANLAVLGFFKYALFVAGAAVSFVGLPEPGWNIVLPIGISFYTFELVS